MKKNRFGALFALLVAGLTFTSCGESAPTEFEKQTKSIYNMAQQAGFEGTYEQWLETIKGEAGEKGKDGKSITTIVPGTTTDTEVTYIVTFNDGTTTDIKIPLVKGQDGAPGKDGIDGNSITKIEKTGTSDDGLTDTYTITFSNGETTTYEVKNGESGVSAPTISTIDFDRIEGDNFIYKITFSDETTTEFEIPFALIEEKEMEKEFNSWKETSKAEDYNNNKIIDIEDYKIYKNYLSWKTSTENRDFDGDKKVTIDDYLQYVPFKKWLASDDSIDLNNDNVISYEDYSIFEGYKAWLNTGFAKDYNLDGKTDIDDYYSYNKFGNYRIINYNYDGNFILFTDDGLINLSNLGEFSNHFTLTWNETGLRLNLDQELYRYLGLNRTTYEDIIRDVKLKSQNNDTFDATTVLPIEKIDTDIMLHFEKIGENVYSTNIRLVIKENVVNISFDILKI